MLADLNPIENVSGDVVKDCEFFWPRTADEVLDRVNSIWDGYRPNATYWQKLSYSMVSRLRLDVENDGHWTKY